MGKGCYLIRKCDSLLASSCISSQPHLVSPPIQRDIPVVKILLCFSEPCICCLVVVEWLIHSRYSYLMLTEVGTIMALSMVQGYAATYMPAFAPASQSILQKDVFMSNAPACQHGQLSCHNTTLVENLCCFNYPGGKMLSTQFWDTSPPTGVRRAVPWEIVTTNIL